MVLEADAFVTYSSYFKLQERWLHSLTLASCWGFAPLPPSCHSNYLELIKIALIALSSV